MSAVRKKAVAAKPAADAPPVWRTLEVPLVCLREPPGPNPNVMSDEDLQTLAANMAKTGCVQPILARVMGDVSLPPNVDAGTPAANLWIATLAATPLEVIDGSHRREGAGMAGYTSVPVTVVRVSDDQARALRIGMNKIRGELDLGAAGRILAELQTAVDAGLAELSVLSMSGYADDEIADLIASVTPPDQDAAAMSALGGDDPPTAGDADASARTYHLDVPFKTKADRDRARDALHTSGGGDLATGLLSLLAE